MDYKEQGLAIRGARLERRMTQAHLAVVAGVSEKTVRRAEGGDRLQQDSIRALCAALGLDASQLRTEAELRPDVATEINAALTAQAVRVRLLARTFAVSALGTGVIFGLRNEPFAFEVGKWAFILLLLAAFSNPLVDSILLALEDRNARARSLQAWLRPRQWAPAGIAAAALMPALLLMAIVATTAALRDHDGYAALLAVMMIYAVWVQANTAANQMLDLEGDPETGNEDPLDRKFDAASTAVVNATLMFFVLPVVRWLFPRPTEEKVGKP